MWDLLAVVGLFSAWAVPIYATYWLGRNDGYYDGRRTEATEREHYLAKGSKR